MEEVRMDFETLQARTPVTLSEIRTRVGHALYRHPLCRNVEFDIVRTPRSYGGSNWTISLHSIAPMAMWEASEIVADIQEVYELAA
jgi:hypothetical protein